MANRRFIDFPIASTVGDSDIILIWQGGANKQTTKATFLSGLPENLDELNDVAISGLTNGQILRYDSVTGKWENTDQGNLDLNDLNDVSIVSPSNGQVLVYNSSTSKWENSSGGYVPYVGAVTTVDLGAQGLRAGYVRFDTTVASVPNEQGLMFWDADDETVDIILNGYTMKIGEDLFYPVKNQTGSTIAKGVAVRFNGTVGNSGRLLIAPFIADGSVPSTRFMGVTAEEILNGEDGKVLYFGRVRGINTNAFNEGDILYASTTVAGGYQTAIPVAPNNIVQVAAVVTKSATVGTIFVRPTLGSNINKDEGVKIVSVADKNLLQYQSGTSLWENKTLAQVIGSDYVPSTRTITINGVSQDLSANRTYNVGTVTSVGLSSATSGVTIGGSPVTGVGAFTLAIATASGSQNGLLSSTDWTTFNSKQNALNNPVTGTGAQGRVAYWNGSGTITSDSLFQWNDFSKRLGIGRTPTVSLDVEGAGFFSGTVTASSIIKSGGTSSQYLMADGSVSTLTNPVTGTGTTNYLPKFTGASTIGNSQIFDNGTNVGIGTATPNNLLTIIGNDPSQVSIEASSGNTNSQINLKPSGTGIAYIKNQANTGLAFGTNNTEAMRLSANGNLLVGTTSDNGARLQVSGRGTFTAPSGQNALVVNGVNSIFAQNIVGGTGTSTSFGLTISAGTNSSDIAFQIYNAAENAVRLFVRGDGNVGIGTASPDVTGFGWRTLTIRGGTTSGEAGVLELQSPTTTGAANLGIIAFMDGSNRNAQIGVQRDSSTTTANMLFYTNAGAGIVERMRITSSGNVGIGNVNPGNFNGLTFATPILDVSGSIQIKGIAANGVAALQFGGETYRKGIIYTSIGTDTPYMAFGVATSGSASSASEYMRITSGGEVLVGTTTTDVNTQGCQLRPFGLGIFVRSGASTLQLNRLTSDGIIASFRTNDIERGSISISGTTTSYNTTSDYRLKEDFKEIKGLEKIRAIKVYDYKWKSYNKRMDGVLAHELAEVLPYAVFGEKDELDEYGNCKMQSVDYSKIVPIMIKSIQELKQEIDTLKN